MRELIEGVTKIRWIGSENPTVPYSLWKHKEGVYVGQNKGVYSWVSPSGVEFQYGVYKTLYGDEGIDHEFADGDELPKLEAGDNKVMYETLGAKVKSTGSSSDYYKIVLPEWLLQKQKDNGFIMLEDLAEIMFDNDFNYVNVMKAQKRMFDLEGGRGKEGNTFEYDATKCKYYTDKQVEVFNRKQEDK